MDMLTDEQYEEAFGMPRPDDDVDMWPSCCGMLDDDEGVIVCRRCGKEIVSPFEPDATEVGLTHAEEVEEEPDENPDYGYGNPDWEHDRARDDDA